MTSNNKQLDSGVDYKEVANKLGIRFRLGRHGFNFFTHKLGGGRKLISHTTLDGWVFDPHQITEALANDPDFSISYDPPTPPPLSKEAK